MHPVADIIRRRLLQHTSLMLPEVGTLSVVRASSRMLGNNRITPPYYVLELNAAEAPSLVGAIASELAVAPPVAAAIYQQWLGQGDGRTLSIEGVCRIGPGPGELTVDTAFIEQLSPLPPEATVIAAPIKRRNPACGPAANSGRHSQPRNIPGQHATPAATGRRSRVIPPGVKPRSKGPHNQTLAVIAVVVALGAIAYLGYYLYRNSTLFDGLF